MNLMQQIDQLQAKAPEMKSALEGLVEGTATVRKLAADLGVRAAEVQSKLQSGLQEVEAKVMSLQEASGECRTGLAEKLSGMEAGLGELRGQMESTQEEVAAVVSQATEKLGGLRGGAVAAESVVGRAWELAEGAIQQFQERTEETEAEAERLLGETGGRLEELGKGVEEMKAKAAGGVRELGEGLEQAAGTAGNRMSEFVSEGLNRISSQFDGDLTQILTNDVQGAAQDFVEMARRKIGEELRGQADEIVEATVRALETRVRDVIMGEAGKAESEKFLLEPALDALSGVVEPVSDALDYIKNLASSVGISI